MHRKEQYNQAKTSEKRNTLRKNQQIYGRKWRGQCYEIWIYKAYIVQYIVIRTVSLTWFRIIIDIGGRILFRGNV